MWLQPSIVYLALHAGGTPPCLAYVANRMLTFALPQSYRVVSISMGYYKPRSLPAQLLSVRLSIRLFELATTDRLDVQMSTCVRVNFLLSVDTSEALLLPG